MAAAHRNPDPGSDRNEIDVRAGGDCQALEVVGIRGIDLVVINGKEHDRGIDDIRGSSAAQKHTGPTPGLAVDWSDIDTGQQPGKVCLTTVPTAPHLADNTSVGQRRAVRAPLPLDDGDHLAVAAFDRNEGAGVEDDGHRSLPAGRERTTAARLRARRLAASISSSLISPCSAS